MLLQKACGKRLEDVIEMEINVNDVNFEQEVLKSEVPVLVDFWAEWCMPCKLVASVVNEISSENSGKFKVCKLNVDEGQRTAAGYGVMGIPTLALFNEGKLLDKVVGVLPKAAIMNMVSPHL